MYEAEGLLYETREEAELARTESDGVRYIRERTKMDDPDVVLKLYNNLLDKHLFKTEVGLKFLFELQEYLISIPYIKSEEIRPIPARPNPNLHPNKGKHNKAEERKAEKESRKAPKEKKAKTPKKQVSYRLPFLITLFLTIVLSVSVISMYVITLTVQKQRMIDYENEVLDRYTTWESELQERENRLKEVEK